MTTATDIGTMLSNGLSSLSGMEDLIGTICFISGGIFGAYALTTAAAIASKKGGQQASWNGVMASALASFLLISAPAFLSVLSQTIFGQDVASSSSIMSYAGTIAASSSTYTTNVIYAYLRWAQFIGLVGYIRGIFLIRSIGLGKTNHSYVQAGVFLFGGAMGANITLILDMLKNTFGVTLFGA